VVTELASRHPERTVFTRFIPSGTGHRHARHVAAILLALEGCDAPATRSRSPGAAIACQALSIDKERHPAFVEPHLSEFLHAIEADGLIVTSSETDVCVLATVLCAVDLGYRVIVVRRRLQLLRRRTRRARYPLPPALHRAGRGRRRCCHHGALGILREVRPTYLTLTRLSIACFSGRSASQ
jgi:hypothetical protein